MKKPKLSSPNLTGMGQIYIKCNICGKFIGYSEFENDGVQVDFTPDTEYTIEKTTFTHKKCSKLNNTCKICGWPIPMGEDYCSLC